MDEKEMEAQRLHDNRMSRIFPKSLGVRGPRRFSAFGNLILDADRQDAGFDPEIATLIDAESASFVADVLEIYGRGYGIKWLPKPQGA